MTAPVGQHSQRFRRPADRLPCALLGVLLLALMFAPARDFFTHALTVEWRPSAEFAFLLLLVTVASAVRPQIIASPRTARILAVLVGALALLNLVDAATPTLLGRELNLYWDLPHLPSLFGLAREAAGFWRMAGAIAALGGAGFLLIAGITWIWRQVLPLLADRRIALGCAVLLGLALGVTALPPPAVQPLAAGMGLDIIRQSIALVRSWRAQGGEGGAYAAVLAAPMPLQSNLAGLK